MSRHRDSLVWGDGEPDGDMGQVDDKLRWYAEWRASAMPGHALTGAHRQTDTRFWWTLLCECGRSWTVNAVSRDEAEGRHRQHLLEDAEA